MKIQFNESTQNKDYLNCIASAWIYSMFWGKTTIDGDELFFGIIQYVQWKEYANLFFNLLWIRKPQQLIDYANSRFIPQHQNWNSATQHMIAQVQLHWSLQNQLSEYSIAEHDNTIALFSIACNALSKETTEWCTKKRIGLSRIIKQLPFLVRWTKDLAISTSTLCDLLNSLESDYNISLWELSNMDLSDLQFLANEIAWETLDNLHTIKDETINNQLALLIDKLMSSLQSHISDKEPLNKIFNPIITSASDTDEDLIEPDGSTKSSISSTKEEDQTENQKKLTVDYFGTDLTKQASNGELDPVIGREREIDQIIFTLLRKTKNSPMLIGEAWVGKTAVVEWLAQKIANKQVPEKLIWFRVINLDVTWMVAGTKYRGEFEQRLKTVLEEASDPSNQIILFIDEIHTIIWAWWHDGNDMAQSIKPMLSRWKIKLLWATTFDEYQKHIEKDAALKRRFQEINIDEPKPLDAVLILQWLKERFQDFHDVNISDKAIEMAVWLSLRYILNKHLPDKAIDLLDEASARKSVILNKLEHSNEYTSLNEELKKIEELILVSVSEQNYFKAAELKQQEWEIKNKLKLLKNKSSMPHHLRPMVDEEDIGRVLSDKLGIPTDIINESEVEKLVSLRTTFNEVIFWQEEAVDKVIKAIQKSRLSVIPKNKPIASFLFLWASGVGKTYIAKLIAEHYFHDPKSLIRIDMSEYMERYSASKIIWSAPGYVGYDEWGSLTEQIRRKPYSVLLLDEIEKADKSILNILLQILDEGQLKDSKGRIIDFKNTIIVMTSNIWSEFFSEQGKQIGFNYKHDWSSDNFDYEHAKSMVLDKLKDTLSPELLNRMDHKIVFNPLSHNQLEQVFEKIYTSFVNQRKVNPKAIVPEFSRELISEKVKELYNPQFWARPIEQYIYNELEDEVIQSLLTQV